MTKHLDPMCRRAALELLGALGAAVVVGCGGSASSGSGGGGGGAGGGGGTGGATSGTTTSGTTSTGSGTCTEIPDETAGPYPDKTGMLGNEAFHRKDVTEGKTGLPLAATFVVVDTANGCAPVVGALVEIWHCDKDGVYSEYGGQPGVPDQTGTTFLRGLQPTDASGAASFTTIYPGWYQGRVTHIHVEVYVNGKSVKVTQMAFPDAITTQVYSSALYLAKGQNSLKNAGDMVFSDGDTYELATLSGDTASGYTSTLTLAI